MSDKYEPLIKAWADRVVSNDNARFVFSGAPIDSNSFSVLFYEQITKRALKKLSICVANTDLAEDKYADLNSMIETVEPIYKNLFDDRYIHASMDDEDSDIADELPEKTFAGWIIYILENDVLPFATTLEKVFIDEAEEEGSVETE